MNKKIKDASRAAIIAFFGALLGGAVAPESIASLLRLVGL